ncbi:MAG TPA: FHA domain-containing protein, partial [Ktedonobacteraceae bacterium]|nr:FHA domain-containing protein [Ktedonobacteraceae bacterium]
MRNMLAVLFIPNGPQLPGPLGNPLVLALIVIVLLVIVVAIIGLLVFRGGKSKQNANAAAPGGVPDWQRQGQPADNAWGQQPGGWGAQNAQQQPQQPGAWGAQGVPQQPQQPGAWGAQGVPQQQPGGWGAQGVPQQQPQPGAWGAQGVPQQQQADPWGGQNAPQPQPGAWGSQPSWDAAPSSSARDSRGQSQPLPPQSQQGHLGIVRVEEGKDPGRVYEVRKDSLSIGRSRESDIFLEDLTVSRLHASIVNTGSGNYGLKDEGSANGTKINGQLVPKNQIYPLQEGDKIQLGQTVLVFGSGEVYKTVLRNAQDRLDTDIEVSGPIRDTSSQDVTKALSL